MRALRRSLRGERCRSTCRTGVRVAGAVKASADNHVASCLSFNSNLRQFVKSRSASLFTRLMTEFTVMPGSHLVSARIGFKAEVGGWAGRVWHERLAELARGVRFGRYRIWLVSNEGFSDDACHYLEGSNAFARVNVSWRFDRPACDDANVATQCNREPAMSF
jgi:hypothetical protein